MFLLYNTGSTRKWEEKLLKFWSFLNKLNNIKNFININTKKGKLNNVKEKKVITFILNVFINSWHKKKRKNTLTINIIS